jgi:hypothetical protein
MEQALRVALEQRTSTPQASLAVGLGLDAPALPP